MTQTDPTLIQQAFSVSWFILVSNIITFIAGMYIKHIHTKITIDNTIVKRLEEENKQLHDLLQNPAQQVKMHDLTKELGVIKAKVEHLYRQHGSVTYTETGEVV